MKISLSFPSPSARTNPAPQRGLTLVETMVTMVVFGMVLMALLYAHIFGLKQDQLVESKLGASDQARKSFEQILRDVRSANTYDIGDYSGGTFTVVSNGTLQQGNALRIFLTTNSAISTTYYFDTNTTPGTNTLNRLRTGDANPTIIADHLTNYYGGPLLFYSEDHLGNVISDIQNKRVVHFTLGFLQYQYPLTRLGSGSNYLYDFYKMEFRVTPHVSDGA
jgi:prepilin-type N-terminal cleavage/methylation domain-containing protein